MQPAGSRWVNISARSQLDPFRGGCDASLFDDRYLARCSRGRIRLWASSLEAESRGGWGVGRLGFHGRRCSPTTQITTVCRPRCWRMTRSRCHICPISLTRGASMKTFPRPRILNLRRRLPYLTTGCRRANISGLPLFQLEKQVCPPRTTADYLFYERGCQD